MHLVGFYMISIIKMHGPMNIKFNFDFGPCIFNNEYKINQQNAQINSGLIYY